MLPLLDSERGEIKNHAIELLAVYGAKKSFEKLESFVDASKPAFTQRGLLHAIDQIKSRQ
ncbi:MAG: hypothetical protein CMJ79_02405 [Planctomycetaceae bacterium]|nr:hypothetical protein [Planctomycetaceae bacterium]